MTLTRRVTSGALTNSFLVKVQEPGPEKGKHFILFLLRNVVEITFLHVFEYALYILIHKGDVAKEKAVLCKLNNQYVYMHSLIDLCSKLDFGVTSETFIVPVHMQWRKLCNLQEPVLLNTGR